MRGERRKSTSLAFEGTKVGQILLPNEQLLPEPVSFVCYQPIPNTSSFLPQIGLMDRPTGNHNRMHRSLEGVPISG